MICSCHVHIWGSFGNVAVHFCASYKQCIVKYFWMLLLIVAILFSFSLIH